MSKSVHDVLNPDNYEIGFKYERFYDFYAGRHLFTLSKSKADPPEFFVKMIDRTNKDAFLWGGVKKALIEHLNKNGLDLAKHFCLSDDQRVKEMMVSVLIDLGRDEMIKHQERTTIQEFLSGLVPPEPRRSGWQQAWQLIRKPATEEDCASVNAQKIAIEVAGELNFSAILCRAGLQPYPSSRTAAVKSTYHLWQRKPDEAFGVLDYWSKNMIFGLVPNLDAFEAVLGLSMTIFFDDPENKQVRANLQRIWRGIISRLFGVKEGAGQGEKLLREFIRETVFSITLSAIFRYLKDLPDYNVVTFSKLDAFFHLGKEKKNLYLNLIKYLDVEGEYSRDQMQQDLLGVLRIRNLLIGGVAVMCMVAQSIHAPLDFLPFLKTFFGKAYTDPEPNSYLTDVSTALANVLDRNPKLDEIFDFFVHTVDLSQEYYKDPERNKVLVTGEYPGAIYVGPYILFQYQRTGSVQSDWFQTRIDGALENGDTQFFKALLKTQLPVIGIENPWPRVALEALDLFFDRVPGIEPDVQRFLSRLRVFAPNDVDDFLDAHDPSDDFRLQVRTKEPSETVGELIGLRSWYCVRDQIILGPSDLRQRLMRVLQKAADCQSAKQWTDYAFREIVNLIYGGEALRQSN